jgi:hypothetical protein
MFFTQEFQLALITYGTAKHCLTGGDRASTAQILAEVKGRCGGYRVIGLEEYMHRNLDESVRTSIVRTKE